MERWGQYFKPAGMGQATGDPVAKNNTAASVEDEDEPAPVARPTAPKVEAAASSSESSSRAQDILAKIRARQSQ